MHHLRSCDHGPVPEPGIRIDAQLNPFGLGAEGSIIGLGGVDKAKAGRHAHAHTDQARTSQREREQWKCSATTLVWTSALDELETWPIPLALWQAKSRTAGSAPYGTYPRTIRPTRPRSTNCLEIYSAWSPARKGHEPAPEGLGRYWAGAWVPTHVQTQGLAVQCGSSLLLDLDPCPRVVHRAGNKGGSTEHLWVCRSTACGWKDSRMPPKARPWLRPPTQSHLVRQWQRRESFAPLFGTVTQETAGFV